MSAIRPSALPQPNQSSTMVKTTGLIALAISALAMSPAQAAEGYAIWDDFNGYTGVNMDKWLSTDRVRVRSAGGLRFLQRDLGSQTDSVGTINNSWGLDLKNPHAITQMRGAISVSQVDMTGCSLAGSAPTEVQARMVGSFFNAGPGMPTSRIGDVLALVRFARASNSADQANVLRVEGLVVQCQTADCNYGTTAIGVVDLGTVTTGTLVTLKFDWDPANDRFNFYRGSDPVRRISYAGYADSLPPYQAFKQIGTRTNVANCMKGPRPFGVIDALFDNISVNASAAP